MDFLNKHYEKIILSVVLLGLAVAAVWLVFRVSDVRKSLEEVTKGYQNPRPKPLDTLDLSTNRAVLRRLANPGRSPLEATGHSVFNPIKWVKRPDGTPVPMPETGLKALTVTGVSPLYLKIEFLNAREGSDQPRYEFRVTREASTNAAFQKPMLRTVSLGSKNEVFTVKDFKGPKEAPTEVVLELNDTKATISVSKDKPFSEVAGYAADLRYEAESKNFLRQRMGQKLTFGGESYNIVAITQNGVTLEDSRTKKRTIIQWSVAR